MTNPPQPTKETETMMMDENIREFYDLVDRVVDPDDDGQPVSTEEAYELGRAVIALTARLTRAEGRLDESRNALRAVRSIATQSVPL